MTNQEYDYLLTLPASDDYSTQYDHIANNLEKGDNIFKALIQVFPTKHKKTIDVSELADFVLWGTTYYDEDDRVMIGSMAALLLLLSDFREYKEDVVAVGMAVSHFIWLYVTKYGITPDINLESALKLVPKFRPLMNNYRSSVID